MAVEDNHRRGQEKRGPEHVRDVLDVVDDQVLLRPQQQAGIVAEKAHLQQVRLHPFFGAFEGGLV